MKLALAVSTLLLLVCTGKTSSAEEIEPAARQVAAAIDSMNVEQHWPAGLHVNWETGVPDGRPHGATTRCATTRIG